MKEYQIVLVNFFTEKKKFAIINAEDHEELQEKVEALGRKNPECIVAAYLEKELQLAARPYQMMVEKNELTDEINARVKFLVKWKVLPFGGEQLMPDYSLPENNAIFRRATRKRFEPIQSIKPVRRTSKGQRAPRVEIFQGAAGI